MYKLSYNKEISIRKTVGTVFTTFIKNTFLFKFLLKR